MAKVQELSYKLRDKNFFYTKKGNSYKKTYKTLQTPRETVMIQQQIFLGMEEKA